MAKEKTLKELRDIEELSSNVKGLLDSAIRNLNLMDKIETTRDSAMVRTKIDEAMMWLGRYYAGVCVNLANRTCR